MEDGMARVLHLSLERRFFDQIATGQKDLEFRKYTPYWYKRLADRLFDEIVFTNGYGNYRPQMRVQCLGITVEETPLGKQFVIRLGRILETHNYLDSA
jgi:hypothetical protein